MRVFLILISLSSYFQNTDASTSPFPYPLPLHALSTQPINDPLEFAIDTLDQTLPEHSTSQPNANYLLQPNSISFSKTGPFKRFSKKTHTPKAPYPPVSTPSFASPSSSIAPTANSDTPPTLRITRPRMSLTGDEIFLAMRINPQNKDKADVVLHNLIDNSSDKDFKSLCETIESELASLEIKNLNQRIQALLGQNPTLATNNVVKNLIQAVKHARRRVKNREYAQTSRQRKAIHKVKNSQ